MSKLKKIISNMSKFKKIMIILSMLVICIPLITFGYLYTKMNYMYKTNEDSQDMSLEEIDKLLEEDDIKNTVLLDDNITNILLIGSDGRTSNERGRSDAMIIATIDEKHKSLKLTSLARDTYVNIPGKGYEKLNHAYSYGGATLLMKTIENNLSIGISDYVNVNFTSFIDIIDALGGIKINVKSSEISELNKYIPECYEASKNKKNSKMKLIEKAGVQTLNGYQALSYSRIRKNDSAIERDGRQRQVLQSLMNEVSTMSFGEVTKVANALFPYVKTNIKPIDMMKYVGKVLKINNFNIKQLEFPIAEYSKGGVVKNKGWVLQFDYSKCLPILHKFIFEEDIKYGYVNNNFNSTKEEEVSSDSIDENLNNSDKNDTSSSGNQGNSSNSTDDKEDSNISKPNNGNNSNNNANNNNDNNGNNNNGNNSNNNGDNNNNSSNPEIEDNDNNSNTSDDFIDEPSSGEDNENSDDILIED